MLPARILGMVSLTEGSRRRIGVPIPIERHLITLSRVGRRADGGDAVRWSGVAVERRLRRTRRYGGLWPNAPIDEPWLNGRYRGISAVGSVKLRQQGDLGFCIE